MSKEYIIVHRIDKSTPLDEHIPLHMTAFHWFDFDGKVEELVGALRGATDKLSPVSTHAVRDDLFGPDHNIPVMRLERTPELLTLHLALEAIVRRLDATCDKRWVGEKNWNPHVTHQPEGRLYMDDEVFIGDLDLITKRHDGMRERVCRIEL